MFDFFKDAYYLSKGYDIDKKRDGLQDEDEVVFLPRVAKRVCTLANICFMVVCGINAIRSFSEASTGIALLYLLVVGIALVAQILIVIKTMKTEIIGAVLSSLLVLGVLLWG